ncbi:NADP-dependent 3-hydroxy acid dehydrogenase YdfG [Lutibacter oricola]|uniref:NADP-dependent 3-hydroxy acid dehydrogenase YdfG n=1 Tax=Lutibacter oricola TaxID=762486 RepID=A0A1H2QY93_9FLAO|nr:oxidoreductase [Lutibacter oricola]SDW12172.1 NADP-dependent 3-hydroxy acid dehydrogenase YdfG [Lutibacter oricola]
MDKKIIIVTGASSGIGKATALYLIEEGHKVYGLARRLEKMQDIENAGGNSMKLDVTNHKQIKEVVASIYKKEGRIDALINNAGFSHCAPIEEVSYEKAKYICDVNLFGLAEMTKAVLPIMRKQKSGTIVNLSSMGGKIVTPLMGWYGVTKFAVEAFSDALRMEVKQFGINVAIIEPGNVQSELAGNTVIEHIPNSAYQELKDVMEIGLKNTFEKDPGSNPIVAAKAISHSINAKKPKTRYPVGKMAKAALTAKKWLSDKQFDKLVMSQLEKAAK